MISFISQNKTSKSHPLHFTSLNRTAPERPIDSLSNAVDPPYLIGLQRIAACVAKKHLTNYRWIRRGWFIGSEYGHAHNYCDPSVGVSNLANCFFADSKFGFSRSASLNSALAASNCPVCCRQNPKSEWDSALPGFN